MRRLSSGDFERTDRPTEEEFPECCRTGGRYIRALFHLQVRSIVAGEYRSAEQYVVGYWWAPIGAFKAGREGDWPLYGFDGPWHSGLPYSIVGWIRLPDVEFDPQSDDELKYLKGGTV